VNLLMQYQVMSTKNKIANSPDRNTFRKEKYIQRCEAKGVLPDPAYIEMYAKFKEQMNAIEQDSDWQQDNLEYDLRSTEWICNKVKSCEIYAQNLYAAMCNNDFQRIDVWTILTDKTWGCSWRRSGGIIADMREQGNYHDWYCSGIINNDDPEVPSRHVPEGIVTSEVENDLKKLGWNVLTREDL